MFASTYPFPDSPAERMRTAGRTAGLLRKPGRPLVKAGADPSSDPSERRRAKRSRESVGRGLGDDHVFSSNKVSSRKTGIVQKVEMRCWNPEHARRYKVVVIVSMTTTLQLLACSCIYQICSDFVLLFNQHTV